MILFRRRFRSRSKRAPREKVSGERGSTSRLRTAGWCRSTAASGGPASGGSPPTGAGGPKSLPIAGSTHLVPTDVGLLALEGISHGNTRGRIIRLSRDGDGRWLKTFIPLGEEPHAAAMADGALIVVTNGRLLRVHLTTKRVDILISEGFWGGLYPNSLIVSQEVIFVGMRHGVARIERRGKRLPSDWLLPMPEFDRVTSFRKGFH